MYKLTAPKHTMWLVSNSFDADATRPFVFAQKLSDDGKLPLLQEMYREWPFMQVLCLRRPCLPSSCTLLPSVTVVTLFTSLHMLVPLEGTTRTMRQTLMFLDHTGHSGHGGDGFCQGGPARQPAV